MLLYIIMVIGVIASLIYMISVATPTTDENNFSMMVNKQTFSKAVDYWLDKLIYDIVNKDEVIKTWCYRLWRFVWTKDKPNTADTVKLEYLADLHKCSPTSYSDELHEKFGDYNKENGGLSFFIQEWWNKFDSWGHDLFIQIKESGFGDYTKQLIWWKVQDSWAKIYTVSVYKVDNTPWHKSTPTLLYEFTWWRNS